MVCCLISAYEGYRREFDFSLLLLLPRLTIHIEFDACALGASRGASIGQVAAFAFANYAFSASYFD